MTHPDSQFCPQCQKPDVVLPRSMWEGCAICEAREREREKLGRGAPVP